MTNTTTASKYIPRRARICINWNPPFKTQIYFVKARPSVNIVKEDLHNSLKQFLTNLWSEVWKGDFNWCCGSICHQVFTFTQIDPGHTVWYYVAKFTQVPTPKPNLSDIYSHGISEDILFETSLQRIFCLVQYLDGFHKNMSDVKRPYHN